MSEPLLAMFATMALVFGPVIVFSYWYNNRQVEAIAASKPATYCTCTPSRSQMMPQHISVNIPTHIYIEQPQEEWTVITPKEIEQHSLPEQSSAAKLTHELFTRRRQDA